MSSNRKNSSLVPSLAKVLDVRNLPVLNRVRLDHDGMTIRARGMRLRQSRLRLLEAMWERVVG